MFMSKLGMGELLLIFFIALVIFGPSKLPELAQSMGDAVNKFRGSVNKVDEEIKTAVKGETKED